jgi:hypothetical protein
MTKRKTTRPDDDDMKDFDGNSTCPDCHINVATGPLTYRRAWSEEEAVKMPEAACPNRRHDTWRHFLGLPAVAR